MGDEGGVLWGERPGEFEGSAQLASYSDLFRLCLGDWRIYKTYENDETGFGATIFENKYNNQSVIAFRASGSFSEWHTIWTDWITNDFILYLSNKVGSQAWDADAYYRDYARTHPSRDISVTGHSLGGGLGLFISTMYDVKACSFNSVPMFSKIFAKLPELLDANFHGVDKLKHMDNISEHDFLAGLWDTASADLIPTLVYLGLVHALPAHELAFSVIPLFVHNSPYHKNHMAYKDYILRAFPMNEWDMIYNLSNFIDCHDMISMFSMKNNQFYMNDVVRSEQYGPTSVARFLGTSVSGAHYLPNAWNTPSVSFTVPDNVLTVVGGSGSQTISSTAPGNMGEVFYGGDGNDSIFALGGNDVLLGGAGNDTLSGDVGDDVYIYTKGGGLDTIYDISGRNHVYLKGFADSDKIECLTRNYQKDGKDYHVVSCNGAPILYICADRSYNDRLDFPTSPNQAPAWMFLHKGSQTIEIKDQNPHACTRYSFGCPVSVQVYDAQGQLVDSFSSGREQMAVRSYGHFYVHKEEDGSYGKVLELFEGYTLKATGEGVGTFSVTAESMGETPVTYGALNLAVQAGSRITLEGSDPGSMVVQVDLNADGVIDLTRQLTTSLEGAPLTTPPTTGDAAPLWLFVLGMTLSLGLLVWLWTRKSCRG